VNNIGLIIKGEVHDTTEVLIIRAVATLGFRIRFRLRIVAWDKLGFVICFAMTVGAVVAIFFMAGASSFAVIIIRVYG
jgi:hypothetical protein